MALERRDLTQLVSFDPPLPQRGFAILSQGTTTTADTWGGSGTDGQTYGYFTLDTTWWTNSSSSVNDLNLLPVPVGTIFQVWSTNSSAAFDPTKYLINGQGAPDLIDNNTWLNHAVFPKDVTLRRVVGIRQVSNTQWNIYFNPPANSTFNASTDGIVTLPQPTNAQWMGQYGHVIGLVMDWSKPGGPTSLSFTLTCPPNFRPTALNAGRRLQAFRGGSNIWDGTLQEPQASPTGWSVTANGVGVEGANFAATYSTWTADNVVNEAIGRGLRWRNDGIGSPPGLYGLNSSNVQDSGYQTVQDFTNLLTTSGALYWSIEPPMSVGIPAQPWVLRFRPFPTDLSGNPLIGGVTAPEQYNIQEWQRVDLNAVLTRVPADLYIINSSPTSRTMNGLYNTLVCKYQVTPDIPSTSGTATVPATYSTLTVDQPSSVASQGRVEYYLDMTSSGVMTSQQVQQVALNLLAHYTRFSFLTAFTVTPGRLLNNGGQAVDIALDWSGKMATVLVENAPVGGDISMSPQTFFIQDYSYDDDAETATVTPYQTAGTDIQSLVAEIYPNGFS